MSNVAEINRLEKIITHLQNKKSPIGSNDKYFWICELQLRVDCLKKGKDVDKFGKRAKPYRYNHSGVDECFSSKTNTYFGINND